MRIVVVGLAASLLAGEAVAAESPSCDRDLPVVTAGWRIAGYSAPAKPAQFRVVGAAGRSISGPDFAALTSDIRAATSACVQGNEAAAAPRIAAARAILAPHR